LINFKLQSNTRKFNKCDFLKFILSVTGGHFDYSPQAPRNLAKPLNKTITTHSQIPHEVKVYDTQV
jgi:hypothetical protein